MPELAVVVSNHAVERWMERFPGEDMSEAFARAERLTLNRYVSWRKKLRKPGPRIVCGSEYYRDEMTEAVFIVSLNSDYQIITTVLRLPVPDRKRRQKEVEP